MKPRILIIEDNQTNLDLMIYLLQEFGYEASTAATGSEGLAAIKRERPQLVLCDIQMPDLDGYELARQVKADPELRDIPLVAVSALAMVGDRAKGLAAGFNDYICKPINPQTFVRQVETYLGLPHKPGADQHKSVTPETAYPEAKRAVILAIDDLSANVQLLESIFQPHGYTVLSASGLSQGLALARLHQPDVIVSDVSMHEGSGFALCTALKSDVRLQHIPVILITSTFADEVSRKKGLEMGAVRFLFRPIESRTLLAEVEACLPPKK